MQKLTIALVVVLFSKMWYNSIMETDSCQQPKKTQRSENIMPYYYPTIVTYKGLRDGCYLFEVDGPRKVIIGVSRFVDGYITFLRPRSCSFGEFIGIVDGCITKGSNFPEEFAKAFPGAVIKGAEYTCGDCQGQKCRITRLS